MKVEIDKKVIQNENWVCAENCPLYKFVSGECMNGELQCHRIIGLIIDIEM